MVDRNIEYSRGYFWILDSSVDANRIVVTIINRQQIISLMLARLRVRGNTKLNWDNIDEDKTETRRMAKIIKKRYFLVFCFPIQPKIYHKKAYNTTNKEKRK